MWQLSKLNLTAQRMLITYATSIIYMTQAGFLSANTPAQMHVGDCFWAQENQRPKKLKKFFFQDKFYSLKAHVHYFTVLI